MSTRYKAETFYAFYSGGPFLPPFPLFYRSGIRKSRNATFRQPLNGFMLSNSLATRPGNRLDFGVRL